MERVRVYEIPACRMVSSGCGMFGDGVLESFMEWMDAQPRGVFPKDFLSFDAERQGFVWYYLHEDGMSVPDGMEIVDFPGGLYAVCTGRDGDEADAQDAKAEITAFIRDSRCFERDPARAELGNITSPQAMHDELGYHQIDYYVPIRMKE